MFQNIPFLRGEAKLSEELLTLIRERKGKGKEKVISRLKVLITGATVFFFGFKNSWEINKTGEYEIYCIAREILRYNPRKRIEEQNRCQGIEISDWENIHFIEGDISFRNFNMSDFEWKSLADNIDSVVHMAAEVNLIKSYDKLKVIM